MKKLKELPIFKSIIIVVLILSLFILNDMAKNGRYAKYDEQLVIDTRTGNIFQIEYVPSENYFKPQIHWRLNN